MFTNRFRFVAPLCVVTAGLAVVDVCPPARAARQQGLDQQTVLKVNMVRGFVTVYINGQSVGTFGKKSVLDGGAGAGLASQDIARYVRGGKNSLRLTWSGASAPTGEIHVSHATSGGGFREIISRRLDALTKKTGDETVVFTLPNAAGLPPSANNKAGGVTSSAPKADVKPSNQVGPGSRARQTLMNAHILRGNVTVYLNDKKVGSYASGLTPLDVSDYVRSGTNALRLQWNEKAAAPTGSIRISYATERNKFRTLGEYDLSVFTKRTSDKGSAVTFNLP